MHNKYYLYRFLNEQDNVLYIGRTNDIRRRIIKEHFTKNTHLSKECYAETIKVEYSEFNNESEEVAYEAILINKIKPKYNVQFKDNAKFNIKLPEIKWQPFEWDFKGQMEIMKELKDETIPIHTILYDVIEKYASPEKLLQYNIHGFNEIDKFTIISPSSTSLIAGAPGTYKTNYALHIAMINALNNRKVLYINLKNSLDSIFFKILSMKTQIKINKFYTSDFTADDWKNIASTADSISKLPLHFYNTIQNEHSLSSIEKAIINVGCDLAIIDDLSAISDCENTYSSDKYSISANTLKKIALKNNCSIISLYSMKVNHNNKRPLISDLPTSLISCSDLIEFLHLDSYSINDSDYDDINNIEIIIAKNPLGENATIQLKAENGRLSSVSPKNE
ncbi:MAG: GIY-YIG nuclease family protein [Oscillospiraceae bacterium]|nr:GIY-YIG nuclease family protein [Oscillospiraceae bacterium]